MAALYPSIAATVAAVAAAAAAPRLIHYQDGPKTAMANFDAFAVALPGVVTEVTAKQLFRKWISGEVSDSEDAMVASALKQAEVWSDGQAKPPGAIVLRGVRKPLVHLRVVMFAFLNGQRVEPYIVPTAKLPIEHAVLNGEDDRLDLFGEFANGSMSANERRDYQSRLMPVAERAESGYWRLDPKRYTIVATAFIEPENGDSSSGSSSMQPETKKRHRNE
jgi:hypothetical protein